VTYRKNLLRHLVRYKEQILNIRASGTWSRKGKETDVGHILPKPLAKENLAGPLRDACWAYVHGPAQGIKLHRFFHHLNSSQAMCFNLFYPFVAEQDKAMPILLETLGLPPTTVSPAFERVLDRRENTNFDFSLETTKGPFAFFEVKLSEDGFGEADAKQPDKYAWKLREFHQESLSRYIDGSWLELHAFMLRYQVLRNISYTCKFPQSTLFFVAPRANEKLRDSLAEIPDICRNGLTNRVRVLYLEDLIVKLEQASAGDRTLSTHWQHFRQKYLFGPIEG
jgi:hypothetical protein